jgi:hypothetical protein
MTGALGPPGVNPPLKRVRVAPGPRGARASDVLCEGRVIHDADGESALRSFPPGKRVSGGRPHSVMGEHVLDLPLAFVVLFPTPPPARLCFRGASSGPDGAWDMPTRVGVPGYDLPPEGILGLERRLCLPELSKPTEAFDVGERRDVHGESLGRPHPPSRQLGLDYWSIA